MKTDIVEKKSADGDINVADITIRQLSRGLYRSTATAFKELISNAYDASATEVRIDTNYPEFDFISCVDNGEGMPLKEFSRFFSEEGIGSSIKRKDQEDIPRDQIDRTGKYDRRIIGRLGIGMLAIGQLCHSFKIESHYNENGEGKAYRAEITFLEPSVPDPEVIIRNTDTKKKSLKAGIWSYEVIEYDETRTGFAIYSSDIRGTFRREMKESVGEKEYERMSFSLSELHSEFDGKRASIRDCKPYLETIWELSILCPLPYYGNIEEYPINVTAFSTEESQSNEYEQAIQFIQERQQRYLNHNFRVFFDGIELKRYLQLPTEKDKPSRLYFVDFDETVYDSPLRFSGYLFAQAGAVRPLELNGIQIRLRGVGIGGYDSTFLRYSKTVETIRNRWVSGEIFVDEGLESALNIDRDSFNEHDEHFKKLQSFLHEKLKFVFSDIKAVRDRFNKEKSDRKKEILKTDIQEIIFEKLDGKLKPIERDLGKDAPIVVIHEESGEIILNTALRPVRRKKADVVTENAMLAYHSAKLTGGTEEERDDRFYQLIKEIIGKLV